MKDGNMLRVYMAILVIIAMLSFVYKCTLSKDATSDTVRRVTPQ